MSLELQTMIPRFATPWYSDSCCDEDLRAETIDPARSASDRFPSTTSGDSIQLQGSWRTSGVVSSNHVFDVLLSRRLAAQEENTTVTSASPTNSQMKGAQQKTISCLFPTCTHQKSGKPSFRLARPPSNLLNCSQKNKEHTNEMMDRPRSEEGTQCSNCNKNRRNQTSQLNSKGPVTHVPSSFIFSHHIHFPSVSQPVHGERKASVCCDSCAEITVN